MVLLRQLPRVNEKNHKKNSVRTVSIQAGDRTGHLSHMLQKRRDTFPLILWIKKSSYSKTNEMH